MAPPVVEPGAPLETLRINVGAGGSSSSSAAPRPFANSGSSSGSGGSGNLGKRWQTTTQAADVESLSVLPWFPVVCGGFCVIRLVRPVVVQAHFRDRPWQEEGGVALGLTFAWLAALCGLLASVLLHAPAPLSNWSTRGLPRVVEKYLHPEAVALQLLVLAVVLEVFHQAIALVKFNFFWSTGVAEDYVTTTPRPGVPWTPDLDDGSGDKALAIACAAMHVVGLLGFFIMVAGYARGFRACWLQLGRLRNDDDRGLSSKMFHRGVGLPDPEAPLPRPTEAFIPPPSGKPPADNMKSAMSAAAVAAAAAAAAAARLAGGGSSAEEGPGASPGPRKAADVKSTPSTSSRQPSAKAPSGPYHSSGDAAGGGGSSSSEARRPSNGASAAPGSPSRAWLWVDNEWVAVRILRSAGASEGMCTVRLPGGDVKQTRHSLLRPRESDDVPPRDPPPKQARQSQRGRSSDSRAYKPGGGRSHEGQQQRPSSAGATGGSRARPEMQSKAAQEQKRPSTAEGRPLSDEEKWAAARMDQLRKDLIALDKCEPSEVKKRLRQLQRELHPDKQPPEMRVHCQPLFHLVQKEWEVREATMRDNQAAAGA
eukprot:TRINITY_DN5813_c0_g1_i1.p1 TRINITY_DN5813_c0_g1~~TRINITY_DN5813_c0_g1_i1.p1  ORF type:complete len:594 (-),score=125.73 TRINITY_DN5813_c0_g1_i1:351-2132(-)